MPEINYFFCRFNVWEKNSLMEKYQAFYDLSRHSFLFFIGCEIMWIIKDNVFAKRCHW